VLAEHQWIIAQYPEQAQIDVWGDDPEAVALCSLAPREAARRVPGLAVERALPVLQRLRLCAMGDHRHLLREKGDPRSIAYLLVPLVEVEIVDDWQVLGLLGTGSKSLVLPHGQASDSRPLQALRVDRDRRREVAADENRP
jgi:3-hydroxy-9,10-secoandrosta-1,3,5(10)-triene-9,17-dione monooxygenase